jgi:type IV pilus assembly protein PilB
MVAPTSKPALYHPLGQILVEQGLITSEQLNRAIADKSPNIRLGQFLVRLGYIEQSDLEQALKRQGRIPAMHLHTELVDVRVAAKLGQKLSKKHHAIAVNRIADYVTVAMSDPQDVMAIDAFQQRLGARVFPVFASMSCIEEAQKNIFQERGQGDEDEMSVAKLSERAYEMNLEVEGLQLSSGQHNDNQGPEEQSEILGSKIDERPIVNLVSRILLEGFNEGASDIHIEPRLEDYCVRFRVDGLCYIKTTIPRAWAQRVMVRIKLMADLDIAQRRMPQDGRSQFHVGSQRVDLRISTTPTVIGEGCVMRILDGGRELQNIYSLGLREEQIYQLKGVTNCSEGFFLTTGPTGSGKTTTLYSILKELMSPERKIITLEDPVENIIEGVTQINANPKIGLTFARGLRSILRQDPDIVLVGEIRDRETAEIAVEGSMTGHIVLSSLHTVGAIESITRLMDMGVEPYQLGDTLKGIVAQRLLRKICPHCREGAVPDPVVLRFLGVQKENVTFYEGRGCNRCRNTGFKGRVGIYEMLIVNTDLRRMIQRGASSEQLTEAAREEGLTSLREEGLQRAMAGEVTLADVLAVTR